MHNTYNKNSGKSAESHILYNNLSNCIQGQSLITCQ